MRSEVWVRKRRYNGACSKGKETRVEKKKKKFLKKKSEKVEKIVKTKKRRRREFERRVCGRRMFQMN